MAFGIDIYRRNQTVNSYGAVKAAGVTFAWVKGTDGNGIAPAGPADNEVRGFQSVGIPVGLYHFSQPGDAAAQARVLLREVNRLGATGVVPMLDMEDNPPGGGANIPMSSKRGWVKAFTDEIRRNGFRPCVYMNDSDAKTIRPDTIADDLVIVIARYGAKPRYGGRYDVHQYSSTGTVPGITARGVDLDESYTNRHLILPDLPSEEIMTGVVPQTLPHTNDWDYVGYPIEAGHNSSLIATQWVVLNATWGDVEYQLVCLGAAQTIVGTAGDNGYPTEGTLKDRQRAVWCLPDGCEGVAVKYRCIENGRLGIAFPQRTK